MINSGYILSETCYPQPAPANRVIKFSILHPKIVSGNGRFVILVDACATNGWKITDVKH
jgi:hypothetical protein